MSFLKRLFQREKTKQSTVHDSTAIKQTKENVFAHSYEDDYVRMGIASPASPEEKELVSLITSAIMVGDNPNTTVKVKGVYAIDENKEIAGIMACA